MDRILRANVRRRPNIHSRKPLLCNRRTVVGCLWMGLENNLLALRSRRLRAYVAALRVPQYCVSGSGFFQTTRLATSLGDTPRRVFFAQLLGPCLAPDAQKGEIHFHFCCSILTFLSFRVQLLAVYSNFVATTLGLPKNQFTTYFKLYLSFFILALFHYAGDYMLYQNWSGRSIEFCLLQAAGIIFEDAVIGIAKRFGYTTKTPLTKLIGFWVFGWFTFCLPLWLDPNLHAGAVEQGVNVSVILGIWKASVKMQVS